MVFKCDSFSTCIAWCMCIVIWSRFMGLALSIDHNVSEPTWQAFLSWNMDMPLELLPVNQSRNGCICIYLHQYWSQRITNLVDSLILVAKTSAFHIPWPSHPAILTVIVLQIQNQVEMTHEWTTLCLAPSPDTLHWCSLPKSTSNSVQFSILPQAHKEAIVQSSQALVA